MGDKALVGVHCLFCNVEYGTDAAKNECPNDPKEQGRHQWEDPLPWEKGPGQEWDDDDADSVAEEVTATESDSEVIEEPELDLPAILDEELLRERKSWDRNGKIYASDLGLALGAEHDGCQLAFWHKLRNAPIKEPSAGMLLMQQAGDLLHDYVGNLMKTACLRHGWEVVDIEKRVYLEHDGITIGSRLDVKIRHLETGWTRVVDIKTKRGGAFRFLNEAKPGNVLQVQAYVKAEDADDGSLLYVDREGQNFMKEFLVERDDARPEKAIEILKAVRDSDEPPEPVGLRLKVVENKGDDSVYINVPWQIEWCDLKECACKRALGGTPPDGILAKLHPNKKTGTTEVRLTPAGKKWGNEIVKMLDQSGDYDGVTFDIVQPKEKK